MVSYIKTEEIKASLQALVEQRVKDCAVGKDLSQDVVELIKHNFLAKFVHYNKEKRVLEVGINRSSPASIYPNIIVHAIPEDKVAEWLEDSYTSRKCDLEFYGKILSRGKSSTDSEVVLM
ncbi:hypothetical protein [Autumnicola edwardsiae]|jgi:hypothetical protein|uniref:Uncharacterized protein n=1 Tax=Autumnicola edwardsiae TaxID=3075594 RepID=A0ABU3CTL3_9FLAO|nr:hypothetical protein [Zunongwangia sp. F297]MDT0649697.1 hypothetical protein [Zunongwangia sp. F297]